MSDVPELNNALVTLARALASSGFDYALIGGAAVILRGYDRATRDIDAVVLDADNRFDSLIGVLEAHHLVFRIDNGLEFARRNRVLLLHGADGIDVDLSMGVLPFEADLVRHATRERIGTDVVVPVATADDLIILKLIAARSRDIDDVRRLLELHPDVDQDRIRQTVTEYADLLEQPALIVQMDELLA